MFKSIEIAEKLGCSVFFLSQLMPVDETKLMLILLLITVLISYCFSVSC